MDAVFKPTMSRRNQANTVKPERSIRIRRVSDHLHQGGRLVMGLVWLSTFAAFAQTPCPVNGPYDACTGTYRFRDGSIYQGTFSSDMAHGQGTYRFSSGAIYVGEFRNDDIHGQGHYTFKTGENYIGEFEGSKRHGYGVLITRDGSTFSGVWSSDNLVREVKVNQRVSLETKPAAVVATLRAIDSLGGFTGTASNAFDKLAVSAAQQVFNEQNIRFLDLDGFDNQLGDAAKQSKAQIRISFLEKFSPNQMPARIKRMLSDIDASGGTVSVQVDAQNMLAMRSLSGSDPMQAAARTRGLLSDMLNTGRSADSNTNASSSTPATASGPMDLQAYAKQFAARLYKQIPSKSFVALKVSAPKEFVRAQASFEHIEGIVAAQMMEASQFGARISPRASIQSIWKEKEVFSDLDVEGIESFLGKIEADYLLHIHLTPGRSTSMLSGRVYSLYGVDKGLMVFAMEPTMVSWSPLQTANAVGQSALALSNYNAILFVAPGPQSQVSVNHIMLQRRSP